MKAHLGVPVRSVQAYHDMEQGQRFGGIIDKKILPSTASPFVIVVILVSCSMTPKEQE